MCDLLLDEKRELTLSAKDRLKHILISGLPGCGSTVYLSRLIKQDILSQRPTIVIDPDGDLTAKIFSDVPEDHRSKLVHIDLGDEHASVGLNMFHVQNDQEKNEIANTFLALMYNLYDPKRTGVIGPRFDHAVRNAILTILYDENPSIAKLIQCLTDTEYVEQMLPKITDPMVKNYWTKQIAQTSDFHKSEVLDYIVSKFSPFVLDAKIRNLTSQESNLDIEGLLAEKKTIIFDFKKVYPSSETQKIIHSVLLFILVKSLRNRAKTTDESVSLYFSDAEKTDQYALANVLEYGRKYHLSITTTTSRLSRLDEDLLYELSRVGTVVGFRSTGKDRDILESFLGIDEEMKKTMKLDLLKKYHAYVKTMKDGDPVSMQEIDTVQQ